MPVWIGCRLFAEPLDANEWQEGQCWSSWQVTGLRLATGGQGRSMRLLPFAAAATCHSMTLKCQAWSRPVDRVLCRVFPTLADAARVANGLRLRSQQLSALPGSSRADAPLMCPGYDLGCEPNAPSAPHERGAEVELDVAVSPGSGRDGGRAATRRPQGCRSQREAARLGRERARTGLPPPARRRGPASGGPRAERCAADR
jgi:hypothetical protein